MNNFRYLHPDDNLAASVTPTLAAGAQDAAYPIANLASGDPTNPWKATTTTCRLVWDFGAPTPLAAVFLVHHNLAAALAGVRVEMHTADAWTDPDFSATIIVPAYQADDWPTNIGVELLEDGEDGPQAPTYRYASLVVSTANAVACAIGHLEMASALRSLTGALGVGARDQDNHPVTEHRTAGELSLLYPYGTRTRQMRGAIVQVSATEIQAIQDWTRASQDRARAFMVWPRVPTLEPWYVRWAPGGVPRAWLAESAARFELAFEEVSRGLRPTPSPV